MIKVPSCSAGVSPAFHPHCGCPRAPEPRGPSGVERLASARAVRGSVSVFQNHFTVTVEVDGDAAINALKIRPFQVVLVGLDLKTHKGLDALEFIRSNRQTFTARVSILGDPNTELRQHARLADETLMKPVDVGYFVDRARTYCRH